MNEVHQVKEMTVTRRQTSRTTWLGMLGAVLLAIGSLALAACGSDDSTTSSTEAGSGETKDATLVLDFVPGPVHAGIYEAVEQGYYEDEGLNLEIIEPTSTADTLKLIDAGKADFGIADGIDVATPDRRRSRRQGNHGGRAATAGRPDHARPSPGFTSPADLDGKTVGVTGVPSDDAILNTTITDAGGDPDSVNKVTIGFNGVQNLESGKVDAFTGFIPADGVQIEVDGFPTTSFALDEYGGPKYPGLVVFSTEEQIAADPDLMQAFVSATVKGYDDVIADPQAGLDALLERESGDPGGFRRGIARRIRAAVRGRYRPVRCVQHR